MGLKVTQIFGLSKGVDGGIPTWRLERLDEEQGLEEQKTKTSI